MKEAKFVDAIPEYSKILASDPNDTNALANRGQAYMETGKLREALADWTAGATLGDATGIRNLNTALATQPPATGAR